MYLIFFFLFLFPFLSTSKVKTFGIILFKYKMEVGAIAPMILPGLGVRAAAGCGEGHIKSHLRVAQLVWSCQEMSWRRR